MNEAPIINDYFAFYAIPVKFNPDLNEIKSKFYAFSKQYHPDFYAGETAEKQAEVLELSTLNNKAYQVLSNPKKRLQYILELTGTLVKEESYPLPQHFLMEMMEVNEAIMELEFEPDAGRLLQVSLSVDEIETQLFNELKRLSDAFDAEAGNAKEVLFQIKDVYYRQKYIDRIRERLPKR